MSNSSSTTATENRGRDEDRRRYLERISAYLDRVGELSFTGAWDTERLRQVRDFLGPWEHNIKLPNGVYTTEWDGCYPTHHEIMRVLTRELRGQYEGVRVLDLGCLEGYFSAECAAQGARVVGIDGKLLNVKKCEFVKSALGLDNLSFLQDDVMNVTGATYGTFDVVLALGLLYHLSDPFTFLANMTGVCSGVLILDTHISLKDQPETIKKGWRPELSDLRDFTFRGHTYSGRVYREFDTDTPAIEKDLSSTASLANETSVWLTESSLIALLHHLGFEQVEKVMFPETEDLLWADVRSNCRILVVAVKTRPGFCSRVL
jgi:SAM-dependent methyltransferase